MQENFVESEFSGGSDRAIKNLFTDRAIKNLFIDRAKKNLFTDRAIKNLFIDRAIKNLFTCFCFNINFIGNSFRKCK